MHQGNGVRRRPCVKAHEEVRVAEASTVDRCHWGQCRAHTNASNSLSAGQNGQTSLLPSSVQMAKHAGVGIAAASESQEPALIDQLERCQQVRSDCCQRGVTAIPGVSEAVTAAKPLASGPALSHRRRSILAQSRSSARLDSVTAARQSV